MRGINIFKIVSAVLGSILVIFGVISLTVFPHFINEEVSKKMYLGFDDNVSYNEMTRKWIEPEYGMSMKIWIFSIVNEAEVIKNGSFPRLAEKGPYTFVMYERKNKVVFMKNDTQVLYRTKRTFVFNASLSCSNCKLSDKVTIPNLLFQFIIDIVNWGGSAIRIAVEAFFMFYKRETPFVTATVGEILFDGYEDPLISAICNYGIIKLLCKFRNVPPKIGFFYGMNETDDGEYLVDTALSAAQNLGKVYEYNGQDRLSDSLWYSPQARLINGTNELFPPHLSSSERLYMLLGQMKRSIYLRYKDRSKVEGVPVWRYAIPPEMYDYELPENRGFCNPETPKFFDNVTQPGGCLPKGFLDMSSTQPGNPRVYMSGSHFFNSPSIVYEKFSGFRKPVAEDDESLYEIEPTTGVIVRVNQRSQLNVGMITANLKILRGMHNMIVPVLWFNETVYFDNGTRSELFNSLIAVQDAAYITGIALLSLGLVMLFAFFIVLVVDECMTKPLEDQERLLGNEESVVAPYDSNELFRTTEQTTTMPPLSPNSTQSNTAPPLLPTEPPQIENQNIRVAEP